MSDFIAKIVAELDTKNLEKKLNNLAKRKHKIKLDVDDSKVDQAIKKTDKLNNKKVKVNTQVDGKESVNKLSRSFKEAEKSASGFGNTLKGLAKASVAK